MKKVAFLSIDSLDGFVCYDHLLEAPLRAIGWQVETVSWHRNDVSWQDYDAVLIRSTWDYQDNPEAFLKALEAIEDSGAHLENPLELVRWNLHKGYLRDLERQGILVVPTLFRDAGAPLNLGDAFADAGVNELVIKPAISANADQTFRLTPESANARQEELQRIFKERDALIQPFFPAIAAEGEFSLFFFGDTFSHAILKTPKTDDFRVQEEHGGRLQAIVPEPWLLEAAEEALSAIRPKPLYARADFVRDTGLPGASGQFYLMEMELIEPSLYFNLDPDAAPRFARVFNAWMDPSAEE
ncbi:MAG: hypothetical protein GC205_00070 [Bacteroidetes bacterium]|nr:hypothetical protein [Bacteroidota bacterium]